MMIGQFETQYHMERLIEGIHHTSINVTDLERSLKFYRDVLGFEPLFEPEDVTGSGFVKAANLKGVAKFRYTHLKVGDGSTLIELIQFFEPKPGSNAQKVYETGTSHIEFRVRNIDEAKTSLEAKGLRFNTDPIRIGDGPLKGRSYVYFSDPDGLMLGLFEEPR